MRIAQIGSALAYRSIPLQSAYCASKPVIHLEYFHDHVRIERLFFDGVLEPKERMLAPDRSRAGIRIELKVPDAEPYRLRGARIARYQITPPTRR